VIKIDNFPENNDQREQNNSAQNESDSITNDNPDSNLEISDSENQLEPEQEPSSEDSDTQHEEINAEDFELQNQKGIIEALIFASSDPITLKQLARASKLTKVSVEDLIAELNKEYLETNRSFRIEQVAGGFRMFTLPEFHSYINQAGVIERTQKLSQAALESLAVIAYKQPITRAEIERIRGVDCGGVLKNLMSKDLIVIDGRSDAPGKPILYRTSAHFLEFFGLPSLDHLPQLSEIEDHSGIPKLTMVKDGEDNGDLPEDENISEGEMSDRFKDIPLDESEQDEVIELLKVNPETDSASN